MYIRKKQKNRIKSTVMFLAFVSGKTTPFQGVDGGPIRQARSLFTKKGSNKISRIN